MRVQCVRCNSVIDLASGQGRDCVCPNCGAEMMPPKSLGAGCVIGDYLIINEIGAGGMGTVFRARQLSKPRDVALKVLMAEFTTDDAMVQNFVREARFASRMRHPSIVEAYDVAMEDGHLYFAMEYVDGPSLKEYVDAHGPFPPMQALQIVLQVADALSYAWSEKKIVHRDIKPDNILLGADGAAKVADLGLAKRLSAMRGDSTGGEFYGTPQCIAPELFIGSEGTVSSDIYALGITLWFMVAGFFPYEGKDPEATLWLHLKEPLPKLPANAVVPDGYAALLGNMLAKRPCHRYGGYMELMADIRSVMDGGMPQRLPSPDFQTPIDMDSQSPLQPSASDAADDCTREEWNDERKRGWLHFILTLLLMIAIFAAMAAAFWFVSRPSPPEPEEKTNGVLLLDTFDKRG